MLWLAARHGLLIPSHSATQTNRFLVPCHDPLLVHRAVKRACFGPGHLVCRCSPKVYPLHPLLQLCCYGYPIHCCSSVAMYRCDLRVEDLQIFHVVVKRNCRCLRWAHKCQIWNERPVPSALHHCLVSF